MLWVTYPWSYKSVNDEAGTGTSSASAFVSKTFDVSLYASVDLANAHQYITSFKIQGQGT